MPQTAIRPETLLRPALSGLRPRRGLLAFRLLLARWQDRAHTRQALTRLDAHLLHDIGLHPQTRDIECQKPFWRD